jgi:hypothetical protein
MITPTNLYPISEFWNIHVHLLVRGHVHEISSRCKQQQLAAEIGSRS